jgi:hypothetical protein
VTDPDRAQTFHTTLTGPEPDPRPQPDQREPRPHPDPEVASRMTADHRSAGHGQVTTGAADPAAERSRLQSHWPGIPRGHAQGPA